MASKKRESEGIALLSMYADDDDDDDMEEAEEEPTSPPKNDDVVQSTNPQNDAVKEGIDGFETTLSSDRVVNHEYSIEHVEVANFMETSTPNEIVSRSRTERLTIVDYGHDEAALSPEPEV